jgi:hypothetical protein
MAISSKISIDVDSAAFAAFEEKFDKYKEALGHHPATIGHAQKTLTNRGSYRRHGGDGVALVLHVSTLE